MQIIGHLTKKYWNFNWNGKALLSPKLTAKELAGKIGREK